MLVFIATIFLPSIAMAKKFVVGFDYAAWAADKTFQVGDVLVSSMMLENTVFKVNGTAFQSCTTPPASEALSNGNDRIVLAIPSRKVLLVTAMLAKSLLLQFNPKHCLQLYHHHLHLVSIALILVDGF
ncbi:blue copper protein 1a [Glycine max]|uniref:blue copper protein 1a n=1 Tax=Glycine max TaxID=3847 RepID=UPI0003DEA1B8|nr:blue copper protein 1a [Glycine max]